MNDRTTGIGADTQLIPIPTDTGEYRSIPHTSIGLTLAITNIITGILIITHTVCSTTVSDLHEAQSNARRTTFLAHLMEPSDTSQLLITCTPP